MYPSVTTTRVTMIRDYRPGDERAILAAHNAAFGEVNAGLAPRSLALWRWQYLQNPGGARIKLALDDEGRVLAHYAGQSRFVLAGGERLRTSHCADSFIQSRERGLAKAGLFVRTGIEFARDFGGSDADSDRWMWGFPVATAQRIGERSLGYRTLRAQVALQLEGPVEVSDDAQEVQELREVGPEFTAFSEAYAEGLGALGVRDAAYLTWRYCEHPEADYHIFAARDRAGELSGYCVGRRALFEGVESFILCDWLARQEAWTGLMRAARAAARDLPIVLVLAPWCPDFVGLQTLGMRVRPTGLLMVGRSYDSNFEHAFWSRRWYYTLGDSDLV